MRQKSARKEMAASERSELLADIVASSNDAIYSRRLDGSVLSWNVGAERIFGFTATEIIGRSSAVLLPPDRHDEMRQIMQRIRRGERVAHFETVRQHKSGKQLQIALSVSPIRNYRGEIIGASTIARDITEQRRLESDLVEMEEQSRQRLGRDVHDGLGQQLGGVELLCRTLAERLKRKRVPEAAMAQLLIVQVEQARSMTRALASGLAPVLASPDGLMQALDQLAASTSASQRIKCTFRCDEPLLLDDHNSAVQLYRIAQEAVANAARHSRARQIGLFLSRKGRFAVLQVIDNGRGLPRQGSQAEGMGLRTMRYRSHLLGAHWKIGPASPRGTIVTCRVPLARLLRSPLSHE